MRTLAAAACLAVLAASALSEDAAPPQDPQALAILRNAAEKQGGASLGALASFQLTFNKLTLPHVERSADGTTTRTVVETDEKSAALVWRGDEIRIAWAVGGKATQRGRRAWNGVMTSWFKNDTESTRLLKPEEDAKDIAEIDRDLRVVRAVADVVLLRRAIGDGTRWSLVAKPDGPAHPGIAITRAAEEAQPALTLWIDEKTSELRAARTQTGAATLDFVFGYFEDRSYPRVSGAKIDFPFDVTVTERAGRDAPAETVLDGKVFEVAFNAVTDAELKPAAATPRGGSGAPAPGK